MATSSPRRVALLSIPALALALASTLTGCATTNPDVATLSTYMSGTFSSGAQAKADPEFRDITLHMAEIWPALSTSTVRWLYIEQAVATLPAKPYRQRVYKLSLQPDSTIRSDVYTLPLPAERFIGGGQDTTLFAGVTPEQLILRQGCSIILRRATAAQVAPEVIAAAPPGWTRDGAFLGSTSGNNCPSELQGASYATSEAVITPQGLRTWDRGFDAAGNQVWGATKGGYEFNRLTAIVPHSQINAR